MTPLGAVGAWEAGASAGWCDGSGADWFGPAGRAHEWASVTKILTAMAVWVAVEEGTVGWHDPVGPPGSTLSHLLSHASGLAPDGDEVLSAPGRRRIYSNRGFELAAGHLARASGMPFGEYLHQAVVEPLHMTGTTLEGSPAWGARGPLSDLLKLAHELLQPTLVTAGTLSLATGVAFPGLSGVLPGFGSQPDNTWGLGVEVRDGKTPHWTGRANSPATFGHFGRSGSFLWVDPAAGMALVSLSDRPFGPWAARSWPELSDAVLAARASRKLQAAFSFPLPEPPP